VKVVAALTWKDAIVAPDAVHAVGVSRQTALICLVGV
jgi:hypothetical protein